MNVTLPKRFGIWKARITPTRATLEQLQQCLG